ncbi:MAG: hypothetical protein IK093_03435 [Ruminiclostridium sp.]|nr:hypothetical protein [Ruminiclostridium sp.]
MQRGINACIYGDPAIDIGDTLMFRGGDVDQRGGIIGVVTSYEWTYRNYHTVICTAAECVGSLASGAVSARTRAQTSKRIDAVDTGGGTGSELGRWLDASETSIAFNDLNNDRWMPYQHSSSTGHDLIEGYNNHHYSSRSEGICHIEGSDNTLYRCYRVHMGGSSNTIGTSPSDSVPREDSIVSGHGNSIPGEIQTSIVTGNGNTVSNHCRQSMVGGYGNSVEELQETIVWGQYNTGVDARRSVVIGTSNHFEDLVDEIVLGAQNSTKNCQQGISAGQNNSVRDSNKTIVCGTGNAVTSTDNAVICGTGASNTSGKFIVAGQVFHVTSLGAVAAAMGYGSMGADYAEYFEWEDGNPDGADRRGMLVALSGDMIVPANGNGFIGVVSASPSVTGNSAEIYWSGRYKKDVFGAVMTDENGKPVTSPDYDPDREYIPRSERPEWAAVGLTGRLTATDDGSCTVGGYVTAKDGIARKSGTYTRARVLRRIDDTHIEVLVR